MALRAYNNNTCRQQQMVLKEGIAAVAAQLHASQGVLDTSYAQIAEHAGVLSCMHGSAWSGDGSAMLRSLGRALVH